MENKERLTAYFRLPTLRITELKERLAIADKQFKVIEGKDKTSKYLFGIEIEVENVHPNQPAEVLYYWNVTEDGSLRNNGREFITYPLRLEQIPAALEEFNKFINPDCEFTERTSVHIHMNVRDLCIEEIFNTILIYLACEKVLFRWVGHKRDNNPFCIPLHYTNYKKLLRTFINNPRETVENWEKYTAMNLAPIRAKGTVEFRHMFGTKDPTKLLMWINFLANIKQFAKEYPSSELIKQLHSLNTTSAYEAFLHSVFGDLCTQFLHYPLQELMEEEVTTIKLITSKSKLNPSNPLTDGLAIPTLEHANEVNQLRIVIAPNGFIPCQRGSTNYYRGMNYLNTLTPNARREIQNRRDFRVIIEGIELSIQWDGAFYQFFAARV